MATVTRIKTANGMTLSHPQAHIEKEMFGYHYTTNTTRLLITSSNQFLMIIINIIKLSLFMCV